MTSKTLTPAQSKKADAVVAQLATTLKVKASDDAGRKNLARYVDKYTRFALKVRGTGPHSHGFNAEQRKAIRSAVNEAFGIKPVARKAPAKAPAKSGSKGGKGTKRSTRKSTAQLAKEQSARAAGSES